MRRAERRAHRAQPDAERGEPARGNMTIESLPMQRRFMVTAAGLVLAIGALVYVAVGGQAATPVSLIVSGGIVVTMAGARQIIPDGAIAIDADTIAAVGPTADILRAYSAPQKIDVHGQVVMPGLINTHTH